MHVNQGKEANLKSLQALLPTTVGYVFEENFMSAG